MNVDHCDGMSCTTIGDVFIGVWTGPATAEKWAWFMERIERLSDRYPDGCVAFFIVLSSSTPPDGPLRTQIQSNLRDLGKRLRLLVGVPLGDSFWRSVVRTIVRGLSMLVSHPRKVQVCQSISEGISMIRDNASPCTPGSEILRDAIEQLAAELEVDLREYLD